MGLLSAALLPPTPAAGAKRSARPESSKRSCFDPRSPAGDTKLVCVHWNGPKAANGISETIGAVRRAWGVEVGELGFRAPLPDGGGKDYGGTKALDIYIVDLNGREFGFCKSDDPSSKRRVWAYCVLDDDYSADDGEYPDANGDGARNFTVAHELFHAIQMAYDSKEPRWMMEGTAVWIEDEVHDDLNDNYGYLWHGPLHEPGVPVDASSGSTAYGRWIFWRYLSETFGPAIVRQVWQASAKRDKDGVQAVRSVLVKRGENWASLMRDFAVTNHLLVNTPVECDGVPLAITNYPDVHDSFTYEEGAGYLCELRSRPPFDASFRMDVNPDGGTYADTGVRSLSVPRRAARYVSFEMEPPADLTIDVSAATGAALIVEPMSGATTIHELGGSPITVGDAVSAVLVLSNGTGARKEHTYRATVAP